MNNQKDVIKFLNLVKMVPALHYSWDLSLAMMFSDIKYQAIFGILSVIDAHIFHRCAS